MIKNIKSYGAVKVLTIFLVCILLLSVRVAAQSKAKPLGIKTGERGIKSIAFSHDNKKMAVASYRRVMLMLPSGNTINKKVRIKVEQVIDIAYTGDDKQIAVVGKKKFNNYLFLIDAETGSIEKKFPLKNSHPLSVACSRDNKLIAYSHKGKKLVILNAENGNTIYEMKDNRGVFTDLVFDRKSRHLYASSSSGYLYQIDLSNGAFLKELNVSKGFLRTMEGSSDFRFLACGFDDGTLKLVEPENGFAVRHLNGSSSRLYSLHFSEDNRYLTASQYQPANVNIWSLEQMTLLRSFDFSGNIGTPTCSAFDPGGKVLWAADFKTKKLFAYDVADLGIKPKAMLRNDKDLNAPQITILEPLVKDGAARVTREFVTIKGSVFDETGVYALKLNGDKLNIENGTDFNIGLKLVPGKNEFTMEAVDVNDMSVIKKFTIEYNDKQEDDEIDFSSQNYLMVIAIDQYKDWNKLYNAVSDAQAVTEKLQRNYNFKEENTFRLYDTDATKQGMINLFKKAIEKVGPNDRLLIYFSGHGFYDGVLNEGYWIPVDAGRGMESDYLPNTLLVKMMKQMPAKHVFVVADACFSGSLFVDNTIRANLDNAAQKKSRWGLASGRLEYVDDGKRGSSSPFCLAILEYLDNNTKSRSTAFEMINYVRNKVSEESKQVPVGSTIGNAGDEGGDYIFDRFGN